MSSFVLYLHRVIWIVGDEYCYVEKYSRISILVEIYMPDFAVLLDQELDQ
jgi:hypothetical protein